MLLLTKTLGITIILGATCVYAQSSTENLVTQARQNADAMLNHDYETFVRFMHPTIVEIMGGQQEALELSKTMMSEIESTGITFEIITIGQPSTIIQDGGEDVAIVPTEMIMRQNGKKIRVNSYLVAASQNLGKKWYFFDGGQMPKDKLAQLYPKLVATIEIPKYRSTVVDELNEAFRKIEEKEGKSIKQVLAERSAESERVIKKIDDNHLRQYIEKREGKKLEGIPTVRLNELLKELNIE